MNKKKKKIKKKVIYFILILIVILGSMYVSFKILNKKKEIAPATQVVDKIEKFEYELKDNETDYYNELFNELKKLLSSEDYKDEDYAILISKLFLTDFYDLNNKIMKSDVGGTQFVFSDYRTDFEKGAVTSVYKFVESNVYGDRKQELPIVKNIENSEIKNGSYSSNFISDENAFYIKMLIEYEKDLGYPTSIDLILVHHDNKLEIVSMKTNNS